MIAENLFTFENITPILSAMIISYLLGSISFSIIVTRWLSNKADIRSMGSGNAGLTNVLRSVGKFAAILTLVGDFCKGIVAMWIAQMIFSMPSFMEGKSQFTLQLGSYLAAICCLLGHIYPCFFGFKGGKGILTASAIILMIDWRIFWIVIGVFVIVLSCSKIVSLASLSATVTFPIAIFLVGFFIDYYPNKDLANSISLANLLTITLIALAISSMVVYMHRSNIRRLLNGTEKKITSKK